MFNIFNFKSRAIITLLLFVCAFQLSRAEFHFDGADLGGSGFMNGNCPFSQPFIGYHFPDEPFNFNCDNYGKYNGFNANPNISGCINPNGPVDKIVITAVTNASFPNSLYTGTDGPITGISQKTWAGDPKPVWSQQADYTSQEVTFSRDGSGFNSANYTQELYFTIRFALNNSNRAFLYFDSFYNGVWKERYVIKWTGIWVIFPVNKCEPLPQPLAEWNFDECIKDLYLQNIAFDDIATIEYPPADGTIIGGVRAPGVRGNGLKFFHDDYVEIGTPAKLDFRNESMSISTWVYATNLGDQDMQILSKGYDGNTTQYEVKTLKRSDGHHLSFRCFQNGPGDEGSGVYSDKVIKAGYWYHVVGTYSKNKTGDLTRGMWKIYINGELDKSNVNPGPIHTDQSVLIGAVKNQTTSVVQHWWDGFIDEVKIYEGAITDEDVLNIWEDERPSVSEGNICAQSSLEIGTPVLWYDGTDLNGNGTPNYLESPPIASGTDLSLWIDKTAIQENANIVGNRIPRYFNNVASGRPGVTFYTDYASNHYGYSDILVGQDNAGEYLTTQNTNEWTFGQQTDKNLLVLFKTGTSINSSTPYPGDPKPYYSDGRQTIAEFGGPLSGFNIYLSQGYLCFGMWNRVERMHTQLVAPNLYPLVRERLYLAHIEFLKEQKNFVVHFSDGTTTWVSDPIDFSGLTKEASIENFAIGGASRTSYHDYNTGETYSDHFDGSIMQVLLYNKDISETAQSIYNFFTENYGGDYQFIYPDSPINKIGIAQDPKDWVNYFSNEPISQDNSVFAYPNPADSKSTIVVNFTSEQNIRIELVDNLGNIVSSIYSGHVASGMHSFNVDCTGLSTGFYTYRVSGDGFVQTGKLIINK